MGLLFFLFCIYAYEYIALEQIYKLISEDEVEFKKSDNF
jgi:hypothetical protein